jgi:hypothetical protein
MIDFTSGQLTWIVIGACSLGGTSYVTMKTSIEELDKKVVVTNVRAEGANEKLVALQSQLTRIENKLDERTSK